LADAREDAEDGGSGTDPGRPERPRLRTRPLGYKRSDVDEALEARDAQLTELRQDVAALWLAFAQHDRMIRALGGEDPKPAGQAEPAAAGPTTAPADSAAPPQEVDTGAVAAEAESIGNQLSELDEVLAAIEMATRTLETTYADEISGPEESDESTTEAGTETPAESEDAEPG